MPVRAMTATKRIAIAFFILYLLFLFSKMWFRLFSYLKVFMIYLRPNLVLKLQESWAHLCLLITWIRNIYIDDILDSSWSSGHYDDSLTKNEGFVDIVGDEEASLSFLFPCLQQLLLKLSSC